MMKPSTYKHNGKIGDIIYSLPTIIALGGGRLYVAKNPAGVEPMTEIMVGETIELLKTQPYLTDVLPYRGETVDYDLDRFRQFFSYHDHLANWHLKAFGRQFDLSKAWLENITPKHVKNIVIHNSLRYRDVPLDWNVLKGYEKQCLFIGFKEEYTRFREEIGLNVKYHEVQSLIEFAQVIKGSQLFIGNQSLGFALAEAMKHPRILEVYHHGPNCLPQSDNARIILTDRILRKTFHIKKSLVRL